MKTNHFVQVVKEDNEGQRVITNFKTIDEGINFLEEIGGRNGFQREFHIDNEYIFRKDDEFLFLEEREDRVYESFDEYIKVIDNLSEIKEMLEEKRVIAEHCGDSLLINYKYGHYFEVNGFVTKEEVEKLLIKYKVA